MLAFPGNCVTPIITKVQVDSGAKGELLTHVTQGRGMRGLADKTYVFPVIFFATTPACPS